MLELFEELEDDMSKLKEVFVTTPPLLQVIRMVS